MKYAALYHDLLRMAPPREWTAALGCYGRTPENYARYQYEN